MTEPTKTIVQRWRRNALVRGAYSFGKVGVRNEDGRTLRRPLMDGRLLMAGEHTSAFICFSFFRWHGGLAWYIPVFPDGLHATVHGAYMSGIRAAEEIISDPRFLAVWNDDDK